MTDFKTQMVQFAARRVVSEVVRVAAREIENQARNRARDGKLRKIVKSTSKTDKQGNQKMARTETGFQEPTTRAQANASSGAQSRDRREPVEFWVNTMIVDEDGAEPIRILTGRPLSAFKADRQVTTSNEDFNRVNTINNAFVEMLNADAAELDLGESKYYSPQGAPVDEKTGELRLKKGIYLQLHREETDHAADAATAQDAVANETDRLRSLFGN